MTNRPQLGEAGRGPSKVAHRFASLGAEVPLLLAAVALAVVPSLALAATLTAAAGGLWLVLRRPPWREVSVTGMAVLVAVGTLAAGWWSEQLWEGDGSRWEQRAQAPWRELWRDLEVQAQEGRQRLLGTLDGGGRQQEVLAGVSGDGATRERVFTELAAAAGQGTSLLLVDSAGEVVAWGGPGLLHELEGSTLPPSGYEFRASFAKTSLLVVLPVTEGELPWRLVAGRTLAADRLPFAPPGGDASSWRWSVVRRADEAPGGSGSGASSGRPAEGESTDVFVVGPLAPASAAPAFGFRAATTPVLSSSPKASSARLPALVAWRMATKSSSPPASRRGAAFALGIALLGLAVLRGVGRWVGPSPWPGTSLVVLALVGVGAVALGVTASSVLSAALLLSLASAAAALLPPVPEASTRIPRGAGVRVGRWVIAVSVGSLALGLLAVVGVALSEWVGRSTVGPQGEGQYRGVDLGAGFFGSSSSVALRVTLALAVLAVLVAAGRWLAGTGVAGTGVAGTGVAHTRVDGEASAPGPRGEPLALTLGQGSRMAALIPLLAPLLALLAAAVSTLPWAALPLLVGALACGVLRSADEVRLGTWRRTGSLALALVLAAVLAAAAWETVHGVHQRHEARDRVLPGLAPPSSSSLAALENEVESHFRDLDLAALVPRRLEGMQTQDLAYRAWKQSPLARRNVVSALVFQPDTEVASLFAFGYSAAGRPPRAEVDAALTGLGPWDDLEIRGQQEVRLDGIRWGQVHYWVRPRPGYLLDSSRRGRGLALDLLQGQTAVGGRVEGLPPAAIYALYDADGFPLVKPWDEAPPIPPSLLAGELPRTEPLEAVVPTQEGRAWAFSRRDDEVRTVLYLPRPDLLEALDRVGSHALGSLSVLALAVLLALGLALPRQGFRELLRRGLRTYSKRLLVAYTVFLLVPLPLINLALLQGVKERLRRQQRDAGEAALASAQRYMGDFIVNLPAGILLDASVFENALGDLSALVRHDVNLYSGVVDTEIASSRPELFTAGLLPKRMPGSVFSRLVLERYNQSSRTNLVDGVPYLELYAPVRLPGPANARPQLFVSLPLLAQQQELAAQLGELRRQSILVTALLFALLMVISTRLAQGFAAPITELVAGTRRIARGEASLDYRPQDLELADLARAIDDMAQRIDQGRRRVLREKHVVERIVEHITSGVVSLDGSGRVLMSNRVAQELLGVSVGDSLVRALERPRSAGAEVVLVADTDTDTEITTGQSLDLAPVVRFLRSLKSDTSTSSSTANLQGSRLPGGSLQGTGSHQSSAGPRTATVTLAPEDGGEGQEWSLVWVPVPGDGEPSALLVVEDATEVLRSQRLQAWAEMARIIAHEIKNPLTPIRLSAEHMSLVRRESPEQFDDVFERCVGNILRQVEELRQIATEFSTYSSILTIEPRPADLVAAAAELVESYRAAPPPGVDVRFETDLQSLEVRFDERLLSRAARNLMENAVRASGDGGEVILRVGEGRGEDGPKATLTVLDTGPGVDPEVLPRIFDPYFSTHDSGTGLGLPIARRVVEAHGGTLAARNRPEGGLAVTITIPR